MRWTDEAGFTLVELLVVIAIIGVTIPLHSTLTERIGANEELIQRTLALLVEAQEPTSSNTDGSPTTCASSATPNPNWSTSSSRPAAPMATSSSSTTWTVTAGPPARLLRHRG